MPVTLEFEKVGKVKLLRKGRIRLNPPVATPGAERLHLLGEFLESGDHSPPVTGQRWNIVAAYQGIHFL